MKFEVLEKEIRGSLLEEILLVMESGEFEDVGEPAEEDEKPIGEMNNLEKALFTVRGGNQQKFKAAIEEDRLAAAVFHDAADTAQKMMWQNIRKRLVSAGEDISHLGIREGWKLVIPEEELCIGIGIAIFE